MSASPLYSSAQKEKRNHNEGASLNVCVRIFAYSLGNKKTQGRRKVVHPCALVCRNARKEKQSMMFLFLFVI